jgi:intergrase/recombinase
MLGQEEPIKEPIKNPIQESKDEEYISETKKYIDDFISKNDYRKAFLILVVFMGKLNDIEKNEVIEYYNDHLVNLGVLHKLYSNK